MNFRISFLTIVELSHFRWLTSNLLHSIIVDGKRIFEKNALSIKTWDIIWVSEWMCVSCRDEIKQIGWRFVLLLFVIFHGLCRNFDDFCISVNSLCKGTVDYEWNVRLYINILWDMRYEFMR